MKILISVGTRPNFIKITRFKGVAKTLGLSVEIVHTGQHYDQNMANVFFDQFDLRPDHVIQLKEKGPAGQIGEMIVELSKLAASSKPDVLLTPGDVNSTLAAGIAANKLGIPLAHLESGLRSNDRTMPEEINRILVDEISDYLFVTEPSGLRNLENVGVPASRIHYVGNTMIDTLVAFENQIAASTILESYKIQPKGFVLMTMHRPATVDNAEGLQLIIDLIRSVTPIKVVFPVHPRTLGKFEYHNLKHSLLELSNVVLSEPMGYFDFQKLVAESRYILTDSGGIQEESTFKQVPCITIRPNTERPVTCDIGTNQLVGSNLDLILEAIKTIDITNSKIPDFWDGFATERVLNVFT